MNSDLFVDKYYSMDPETEDLIFGSELQEGMVVLVENPVLRSNVLKDPHMAISEDHKAKLLKNNRWCEVSKLRVYAGPVETQIYFIGIYSDGTKMTRVYSDRVGFYVKKDSFVEPDKDFEEDYGPTGSGVDEDVNGENDSNYKVEWNNAVSYAKRDAEATTQLFHGVEETTLEADPEPLSFKVDIQMVGNVTQEQLRDILKSY